MDTAPHRAPRLRLPAAARMRSQADFRRALDHGVSAGDRVLKLWVIRNDAGLARLGMMVGRRYGNAPQRNRIKRLFREAFRLLRPELPADLDLVCSPRVGPAPSLAACMSSLRTLCATLTRRIARG